MTEQWDVIVIGSGAGALTSATVSAQQGLKVLVVEKTEYLGGTSALSGGMTWIPNSVHAAQEGIEDSFDQVMTYLESLITNHIRRDAIQAFLTQAPKMLAYMEANTEVRFVPSDEPDYFPELPGSVKIGRAFNAANYDGKRLGEHFSKLRPPLKELMVFGGAMVDRDDLGQLLKSSRSFSAFMYLVRFLARYAKDRLRYPRGTRLTFGNALVAALLKSALDAGATLWTKTPALGLIRENGRVIGVRVSRNGREESLFASAGIVVATGGFIHNDALRRELLDFPDEHVTMVIDANKGEGIEISRGVGAVLGSDTVQNALGYQVSYQTLPDGQRQKMMLIMNERSRPGSFMVNQAGRRFTNEAMPYSDLYRAQTTAGAVPAYLICDHAFLRRVGFGLVRPGRFRQLGKFIKSGYLVRASTIAELARKLDIDADNLKQTVETMNRYAELGRDLEFGRGDSLYDRRIGDPTHKPNPNLGPIGTAPFYAIRVWPGSTGTLCGLLTDGNAQVLDKDRQPIPGLYACGLDMHSIFSGTFPGAGCSLGPAMTFGYTAAMQLAASRG